MRRFLLSLGLFVLLCAPALAGQLFPPENSAACVSGKVLKWSGDSVVCVDPLDQATITCPAGQVMRGVTNGVPDCVVSMANLACSTGQVLTGITNGNPVCATMPTSSTSSSSSSSSSASSSSSSSCTPVWVDSGSCNAAHKKPQQDGCGHTQMVTCTLQAVGGGNCSPYTYTTPQCVPYGCGGNASCPSTWVFWGVGKSGNTSCTSGQTTYGSDGNSFTCSAYQ